MNPHLDSSSALSLLKKSDLEPFVFWIGWFSLKTMQQIQKYQAHLALKLSESINTLRTRIVQNL